MLVVFSIPGEVGSLGNFAVGYQIGFRERIRICKMIRQCRLNIIVHLVRGGRKGSPGAKVGTALGVRVKDDHVVVVEFHRCCYDPRC